VNNRLDIGRTAGRVRTRKRTRTGSTHPNTDRFDCRVARSKYSGTVRRQIVTFTLAVTNAKAAGVWLVF
jgi:hypothetical protein